MLCPVTGCAYPNAPTGSGRRAARRAAGADLLLVTVSHIDELARDGGAELPIARALDMSPDEISRFSSLGRLFVRCTHARAHRDRVALPYRPTSSELSQWSYVAARMTSMLAVYDTDWFRSFWSEVMCTRDRVPAQLRWQLRHNGLW